MPAWSVARTSKVWLPAPSAARSCAGWCRTSSCRRRRGIRRSSRLSVELKLKLGVVLLDGSAGLESIVVLGALRSTVQV